MTFVIRILYRDGQPYDSCSPCGVLIMGILELIWDALPEALGGILAALILGTLAYLWRRSQSLPRKLIDKEASEVDRESQPQLRDQPGAGHELEQTRQRPHNLASPPMLVGRHVELGGVCEGLSSAYPVVSIQGMGGVGKSTLALAVAHLCCQSSDVDPAHPWMDGTRPADLPSFEAAIWFDQKHRSLSLERILETIAMVLDRSEILRLEMSRKVVEVARLLQSTKCLLVVDNLDDVEGAEQAALDFLLTLPAPSKALITTRRKHLFGTWVITLEGLSEGEVASLVNVESSRLGLDQYASPTPEVIAELREYTGGVPLAIKWILGGVKQRGYSLAVAVDSVARGAADLYEDLFAKAWQSLSERCKIILCAAATFRGSWTLEAMAFVVGDNTATTQAAVSQLTEVSLLEAVHFPSTGLVRYELHPLTHHFVSAQEEYQASHTQLELQISIYYSEYLARNGGHKNWKGFPNLQAEADNILAVLDWSIDASRWAMLMSMVRQVSYFWAIRGYWEEYERHVGQCVNAAASLEDRESEAHFRMLMSWLYRKRGQADIAHTLVKEALEMFEQEKNLAGIAWSTREMGAIAETQEQFEDAEEWYAKSLELWKETNRHDQISHLLKDLGELHRKQGDFELAREYVGQSLAIERERGDSVAIANRTSKLGQIAFSLGDYPLSERLISEGLAMHKRMQNHVSQSLDLWYLAQIEEKRGNVKEALDLCCEAYDIHMRLDLRDERRILEAILESIQRLTQAEDKRDDSKGINQLRRVFTSRMERVAQWKSKLSSK